MSNLSRLSRRERQIMESLYRRGHATVAEVRQDLPNPPTDSAVRAALLLLERKGHVRGVVEGPRNVYAPVITAEKARGSVLREVVATFFRGSRAEAMAELLSDVTEEELDRAEELLRQKRTKDER